MRPQGPVAHAIHRHDGPEIMLHGVDDGGAHAARGGAAGHDQGIHPAETQKARELGVEKRAGAAFAHHQLARHGGQLWHDLRERRGFGQLQQ